MKTKFGICDECMEETILYKFCDYWLCRYCFNLAQEAGIIDSRKED